MGAGGWGWVSRVGCAVERLLGVSGVAVCVACSVLARDALLARVWVPVVAVRSRVVVILRCSVLLLRK